MILGGITTALNPLFYRRAYAEDGTLKDDWSRLSSLFLFAALIVGLTLALVGPDVLKVLTPDSYHEAASFMPLLVLGQILLAIYWLFSPAIGFRRKMWAFPVASFTAMGVEPRRERDSRPRARRHRRRDRARPLGLGAARDLRRVLPALLPDLL